MQAVAKPREANKTDGAEKTSAEQILDLADALGWMARELARVEVEPPCNTLQKEAIAEATADLARASMVLRLHFERKSGAR